MLKGTAIQENGYEKQVEAVKELSDYLVDRVLSILSVVHGFSFMAKAANNAPNISTHIQYENRKISIQLSWYNLQRNGIAETPNAKKFAKRSSFDSPFFVLLFVQHSPFISGIKIKTEIQ